MRRIRPDIVHCNLFDDSLPGLIAARLAGIRRRVLTRQDTGYHWMHARRWVALDRWNNRMATHIIAISEENRRFIIDQEGADERKVTMVHNGIPPERFTRQDHEVMQRLRERFGLSSENLVFGSVARYGQWKGHRHVLDAAARIVSDHPNARFLLCGSGALRPSMEDLARSLGIASKVHFIDRIEPGEMPSFYGILDAFLHAAVMEPFGLVYAEAMMNAVPVVSTRTGAAADAIIDGVNGILIKDPTGEALALGVERLLALDRHAIGRMGRDTALRKYAFDVMWKGTMHVYQAAMSGV